MPHLAELSIIHSMSSYTKPTRGNKKAAAAEAAAVREFTAKNQWTSGSPACELTSCKLTTNGPIKGTVFPGPALKAPKGDGKALGSWLKMQEISANGNTFPDGISYSTSFQFGGSYICRECVRIQCHPRDKSCCLRNNCILQEAKRQTSSGGQRYALLPAQCSGLPLTLHTTWHRQSFLWEWRKKERRPCPLCSLQRKINLAYTCYKMI